MRKLKRWKLRRFLEIKLNLINNENKHSPGEISFGSLDFIHIPRPAHQYSFLEHTQISLCSVTFFLSSFPISCPSPSASRHILYPLLWLLSTSLLTDYISFSCHLLSSCVFRKRDPQQQWVHSHFEPGISVSQHLFKDSKHGDHSWFFHCCSNPHVHTNEKCTDFF